MTRLERQQAVLEILQKLHGLDPLKELFWSELNYQRINQPLPRRGWTDTATNALAEDPLLFAAGGQDNDFHVIYARLAKPQLRLGLERPVVSRLLRDHPYSLFVFSNAAQDRWHFLNIKYTEETAKRRLFRRITIGREERLRTASERLALLDLAAISPTLFGLPPLAIQQRHDEAFDVEAVTSQFFGEYDAIFRILQSDLAGQTKNSSWAHDYALQFLNRCMFLYFVQRKRWLGDDTEFFRLFWESYKRSGQPRDSFFHKWLTVLFFEAFNNKFHGGHTQFPQEIRETLALAPYLNGGLFEKNDLDHKSGFTITDTRFEQVFKFLERYNFTIAEDSPLDQEVAVDPEMIGKVYESLVNASPEVDTRGDAGIFYTPRTEIDLMCRLALVDRLTNSLGRERKNLLYEVVFALEPEEKIDADQAVAQENLWPALTEQLREITVVDPACGSGSFLVGMLHILDDLQKRAAKQLGGAETAYDRKKRIIGQNLYGVDVMDWACHVAELRLWLALIIDAKFTREELHIRNEPLLPHFTFNIRCGDSMVQEVGGLNLGHRRGDYDLSPALKTRISRLKTEKLKFYLNDPSRQIKTADQAKEEELRLFRDILEARFQALDNRRKELRRGLAQITPDAFTGKIRPQDQKAAASLQADLEALNAETERIGQARGALISAKDVPFVWDIAFVEIFGGEKKGFDIVIGNPPYVRQENISDPRLPREQVTADNKKEYKAKLARSVYHAFPRFFGYKPAAAAPAHKLDGKSDLYIYFYFHGLSLLNPKGAFCFITSNSWLDVGYGADLQEFLLKHCRVHLVLDNQAKRSFASADVNTVIALFSAPDDRREWALDQTARFVMFKVPFEHILSPVIFQEIEEARERHTTPEYRVFPLSQRALLENGSELPGGDNGAGVSGQKKSRRTTSGPLIKVARYIGNKWGGKYLRAPEIYWTILDKGKGKLVRLGDIAEVRFGIKTGVNEFFFLDNAKIREWGIEEEFLRPVIKSPRESKRIVVDINELNYKIFMCSKNKKELNGTASLEYINWGKSKGFHKRPSCSGRSRWWDLGNWTYAQIFWVETMYDSFRVYRNKGNIYESDKFYGIIYNSAPDYLCFALNSSIVLLWKLLSGFASLGDGALKTPVYEVKNFLVPVNLDIFSNYKSSFLSRDILSVEQEITQPDHRELDDIVFDTLGLNKTEREDMYEALIHLVDTRLKKAESLNPKERRKRLAAVEKTGGIWAGLPEEEDNGE